MLVKFAVKNFRGFAERIEWNLLKPANYEFNKYAIKDGVVKNGIIYGPNGVGKSNFGLAIFDIEYHLAPMKAKKLNYYQNYVFAGDPSGVVQFEYTFDFNEKRVKYEYIKDISGILLEEKLTEEDEVVFYKRGRLLDLSPKIFPNDETIRNNIMQGSNNVSMVGFLMMVYPLPKDSCIIKLNDFANRMLWFKCLDVREFIGIETQTNGNIEEYIICNNLVDDFATFLKDVSEQEFDFVKPNPGDKLLLYKVENKTLIFQATASTGTTALELLYFWIKRMGDASFVFIDEFDAFYHFRLAFNVCKWLCKLDCQVFTSSHNTYLMTNDLLRPDCNFILNHNKIKPLSDCTDKELRFAHNIEKIFRGNGFSV